MQRFVLCLWALLSVTVLGCSTKPGTDYSQIQLLSVSGTVTLDGQPLPNAVITFEEPEMGTFSYGMTDSSGQYSLRFDSEMTGCTPGSKRVEISTTRKILGLNTSEEGAVPAGEGAVDKNATPDRELVPARYNKKTDLSVEVDASATKHDFELTSK